MELFNWGKNNKQVEERRDDSSIKGAVTANFNDGAVNIEDAVNNFILNFDWTANDQAELIRKYREVAKMHDVEYAIQDIVNEAVSFSDDESPIKLDLEDLEDVSDNIKEKINVSFDKICKILKIKETIHTRLENFYIDGRLAYQKVVDPKQLKKGLLDVVELDVVNVQKYRNIDYNEETKTINSINEFFVYDESKSANDIKNIRTAQVNTKPWKEALQLAPEAITYVTSGKTDDLTGYAISWLHKAIKPANQLNMMEQALVIYRITRAPERRVFYVDVGKLPKSKAEQYLENLKNSYRNRMSYDPEKGSFKDDKHLQTMQEDFWLPRNSNGKGTEVSTLPGGANLDSIEDVNYFLKRLYKALNVPTSRLEQDSLVNIGGSDTEVNRDELKFSKFISKVRKRFDLMFLDLLRTELLLTKVMTKDEWEEISQLIKIRYSQDQYLEERRDNELLRARLELVEEVSEYIGVYYSHETIRSKILHQTEDEQKHEDELIEKEKSINKYNTEEDI